MSKGWTKDPKLVIRKLRTKAARQTMTPAEEQLRQLLTVAADMLEKFQPVDEMNPPLQLPPEILPDGTLVWPGDPRFGIRVRNIYGVMPEQIVEASSLVDALTKARAIPLHRWIEN